MGTSPLGGKGVSDIPEQQGHWHGPRTAVFPMISFLNGRFCCSCPIPTPALHIGGTWAEPDNLTFCLQVTKIQELSLLSMAKVVRVFVLDAKTGLGGALKAHGYGLSRSTDLDGDSHRLFSILPSHSMWPCDRILTNRR